MFFAHTYIEDPSAKYWALVFCLDREDAQEERGRIWKEVQPESSYGVAIHGCSLREALAYIGIQTQTRSERDLMRHIKDLIPYSSDRLQSYLIDMLVRISIYRRMKLNLEELERKANVALEIAKAVEMTIEFWNGKWI